MLGSGKTALTYFLGGHCRGVGGVTCESVFKGWGWQEGISAVVAGGSGYPAEPLVSSSCPVMLFLGVTSFHCCPPCPALERGVGG